MARYTFTHRYAALVTHEVSYELPEGLTQEEALGRIAEQGIAPVSCEAVDEDFQDDLEWDLLSVEE